MSNHRLRFVFGFTITLCVMIALGEETNAQTLANCQCQGTNSIEVIINDHLLPHEGLPFGIPSNWDWSQKPVTHSGINPAGFTAR